jgi:protein transport protein SEC20
MPPLPTTFDDIAKGLLDALERRQKDIRDFQIPRLRACTGPLSLQQRYAAEVREDVDVFARDVEVRLLLSMRDGGSIEGAE